MQYIYVSMIKDALLASQQVLSLLSKEKLLFNTKTIHLLNYKLTSYLL